MTIYETYPNEDFQVLICRNARGYDALVAVAKGGLSGPWRPISVALESEGAARIPSVTKLGSWLVVQADVWRALFVHVGDYVQPLELKEGGRSWYALIPSCEDAIDTERSVMKRDSGGNLLRANALAIKRGLRIRKWCFRVEGLFASTFVSQEFVAFVRREGFEGLDFFPVPLV